MADQVGGTFAHLRHATRGRGDLIGMHHLNRVYHQHLRLELLRCPDNGFHVGLGHESQFVCRQLQALRTHGDLLQGFLPGDIQGLHGTGEMAHGLQ